MHGVFLCTATESQSEMATPRIHIFKIPQDPAARELITARVISYFTLCMQIQEVGGLEGKKNSKI